MNNFLKSLFITTVSATWLYAALHMAQYLLYDFRWIYVVSIVVPVVPLTFLLLLFRYNTPRTSRTLAPSTILIFISWTFVLAGFQLGWLGSFDFFLSTLAFGGWILYLGWYSHLGNRENEILEAGKKFPEVHFVDVAGNDISNYDSLAAFTVYLFYRGNWCPLCMAQIRELTRQYHQLEQMGVRVALISPQPMGNIETLANKLGVKFAYWQDTGNKVARRLKIDHAHGTPFGFQLLGYSSETVLPTLVVTDTAGIILFADLTTNYRDRPEPATFLKIIEESHTFSNQKVAS